MYVLIPISIVRDATLRAYQLCCWARPCRRRFYQHQVGAHGGLLLVSLVAGWVVTAAVCAAPLMLTRVALHIGCLITPRAISRCADWLLATVVRHLQCLVSHWGLGEGQGGKA